MTYYTTKTAFGSTMNIASDVFVQAAKNTLDKLVSNELKDTICLKSGRKTCKVLCEIDKRNKINVNVEIFMYAGQIANSATGLIQQSIYDEIYEITEINNVKVNVIVLGFVQKK